MAKTLYDYSHRFLLFRPLWLRRLKRRHRWLFRFVLAVPLLVLVAAVVLMRSPLARALILPRVESALNLRVEADSVYINRRGHIVLNDAAFILPNVPGAAGRFLRVARVTVDLDWGSVLSGPVRFRSVSFVSPTLTVSQSTSDGSLNLGALDLPASGGTGALPAISVTNAGIELGEHRGAVFKPLKRLVMDGSLAPIAGDASGAYQFVLTESGLRVRRSGSPPEAGFKVTGTLHRDGQLAATVENFSLSEWNSESIPTRVRERFSDLDLAGDVPRASITYSPTPKGSGVTAELELHGVGMNIPAFADAQAGGEIPFMGPPATTMRVHEVNGKVTFNRGGLTAEGTGLIEDVPYEVSFAYRGTDEAAPFTCEVRTRDFHLTRASAILPYLPVKVTEILQIFSGPTAVVNSHVILSRGAPTGLQAADIVFTGAAEVADGVAAFEGFPYEFRSMTAQVVFDTQHVEIQRITGVSESGAELTAHANVAPLDNTSETLVDVNVVKVPIDGRLEAAFGPERKQIVGALFNQERFAGLVREGLIRTPAQADEETARLGRLTASLGTLTGKEDADAGAEVARLTSRQSIPVFEFRGSVEVAVRLHSPRGVGTGWRTQIDIEVPRVGLIPESFPMPVVAENVHARITDKDGQITRGSFRGLTGGAADVEAYFRVPQPGSDDRDPHIEVSIAAREVPISDLVIQAIPGPSEADEAADEAAGGLAIRPMLRRLRLQGVGDADVRIADRETPGSPTKTGFDVAVSFAGATAHPEAWPGAAPVTLEGITGRVDATERGVNIDASGQPRMPVEGGAAPLCSPVTVKAEAKFHEAVVVPPAPPPPSPPAEVSATVTIPGLAVGGPVESLLGAFSPSGARALDDLRRMYSPAGYLDATVHVANSGGVGHDGDRLEVEVSNPRSLAANILGGRMEFPGAHGTATLYVRDGLVRFAGEPGVSGGADGALRAPLVFQGVPCGTLDLRGALRLGSAAPAAGVVPLKLSLTDAAFEAPLIFRILEERLGRDAALAFGDYHAKGNFDAEFDIASPDAGPEGSAPAIRGRVRPHTLTALFDGVPASAERMSGEIEFDGDSGALHHLAGEGNGWSFTADGDWQTTPEHGFNSHVRLSVAARRFNDELLAVMPAELRRSLKGIDLAIEDGFEMTDATVEVGSGDRGRRLRFDGAMTFKGASLDVGVPIRQMAGSLRASVERAPDEDAARFTLEVSADSFDLAGAYVRAGKAVLRSGERPGEVVLDSACGECYGGRLVATAQVLRPDDPGAEGHLSADVRLAGVRLAPLLEGLTARPGQEGPPIPDAVREDDRSRGVLDADLSLTELVGDPQTRRGRGTIRVSGGRIISFPTVVSLIELSNLRLPSNSNLDFARGIFYLDGRQMIFDELAFVSTSVEIVGAGSITWPSQALDFRFNSRSSRPIPILSKLLQGIRDELITTRLTGTISDPVVNLQQFPGPRRMLARTGTDSETRERQDDAAEARVRRRTQGIQPSGPGASRRGDAALSESPNN